MQRRNIEFKNNAVFLSIIFLVVSIFLFGDYYKIYKDKQHSKTYYRNVNSKLAQEMIGEKAIITIKALKFLNFKLLDNIAHPKLGVRLSPYPYIISSDKVILGNEIEGYYKNNLKYDWGHNQEMEAIHLTFKEYYNQYIYNQDFANYDDISYNSKLSNPTKMIDNTREFYPNSIIIEFKINGVLAENQGKDWTILRLVFDNYKDDWYLVGIINLRGMKSYYDNISTY